MIKAEGRSSGVVSTHKFLVRLGRQTAMLAFVTALMFVVTLISSAHAADPGKQPSVIQEASPSPPIAKLSRWLKPSGQWVDNNTAFFGCMTGFSVGILTLGLPPAVNWAFYIGVPIGTGSIVLRSSLGCYAGLLGAGAFSASASLWDRVGRAWQSLW
ncbi:membrane hypothetical protein [Azospirillaceae bacterium]